MSDYLPPSILPTPYDIVWCRFPFYPDLKPALKARPALVRNTAESADGILEVEVVYGSTNLKSLRRQNDFYITKASEMDACGLYRATRFDLDNLAWLPWTTEWFATLPRYPSPIIGHLSEEAQKALQFTIGYRQRHSG